MYENIKLSEIQKSTIRSIYSINKKSAKHESEK